MCGPVCLWCWGGVELQHRPCDVPSYMYVGLGWRGVTTHQVMCCPLCLSGGVGWGYNTPCDVLSCISVGLGWGGATPKTM